MVWPARIAVFGFIALLSLIRLGAGSLWDNSETTYGEIVKELFLTHDWLTLHLNFAPWYIHPPLWFWTTAAFVRVFGLTEFALRLPSAIFGFLAALAVYRAGRRLYGESAGLVAVLAAAGSLEWIMLSRLAILDTMLLFFMTVATLWAYFAVFESDRRAFWIAVLAAALGTLTKGPVAVVLPLAVLAAACLWMRTSPFGRGLPWAWGTLAYVLVAGSWFAAAAAVHGASFLLYYFGVSNIGRYLSPFENQPGPFWYYLPVLALGFFPYVAFVPQALKTAWQARDPASRYLLCSIIVPFVFFSAAQTKLPNYIAVVFPELGILTGRLFRDALQNDDVRSLRGALIFLPASLVLLTVAVILYGKTQLSGPFAAVQPQLALLAWFVVLAALATFAVTYVWRKVWVAPVGLSIMMAGFIAIVIFALLPRAEAFKPMKAMARTVMAYYRPGDTIGVAGLPGGLSLLFYTGGHGVTWVGDSDADARPRDFFNQPGRVLCVVRPSDYRLFAQQGARMEILVKTPGLWLVTNARTH
jgi:4-amino-4-deoxy-L-arabinose transferase-like glycosyltransferase